MVVPCFLIAIASLIQRLYRSSITLFAYDLSLVPVNKMVIVHNMVRYCRFMDHRLRRFTSGSCFYARGKFFCLNAMFLQTLVKLPTSFTNVGHRTVFTRDGVNNICGVKRVPLVSGMDKHISECTVRFHTARDIIGFKSPGNPFRNSFHVRDSYLPYLWICCHPICSSFLSEV